MADRLPANIFPVDNRDALREEFSDYQLSSDLPRYDKTADSRLDTFWGQMGKLTHAGERRFPHLSGLMKVLLVVPAGNASSERVFSQVRKISTCFRSELGRDTICALLNVKWNSDATVPEFSPTPQLLRAAKSATATYNQAHTHTNNK